MLIYETLFVCYSLKNRSLPKLEIIGENSLMSILRWPFKFGMDKTLSSSDNGEISLVSVHDFMKYNIMVRIPCFVKYARSSH